MNSLDTNVHVIRVAKNSELKGAHFEIFQGFSSNFAKNVRFLYYREANKKRHQPLKVAPMRAKAHVIRHSALSISTLLNSQSSLSPVSAPT